MTRKGQSLYDWCIENGEYGQQLLFEFGNGNNSQQFYDTENKEIKGPKDFIKSSAEPILWNCKTCGFRWYSAICNRTRTDINRQNKCPKCNKDKHNKYKVTLLDWCNENNDFGKQLLNEWTGLCDNGNRYSIDTVGKGSQKRMLWRCSKGHEWYATIQSRILHNSGCRYCIDYSTDNTKLINWCVSNGDTGKNIISEWTGLDEHNKKRDINIMTYNSNVRMLWRCSKGHEWYATIQSRTYNKSKCQYCSKRRASTECNLYTWAISEKSLGEELISQWTGISDTGKIYAMTEKTLKSRERMLWRCSKGHEWYATIYDRTIRKSGCRQCSLYGTSYPEQFLYRALIQLYPQTITRGKFKGIEYDLTIPEEKTCIEYSGYTWHKDKAERDQMKADICKEHDVRFIQIYAHHGEIDTSDSIDSDFLIYKADYNNKEKHNQQLTEILAHILKSFGHSISEIDIEKAQTEAFNFMHNIDDNTDESDKLDDYNF